MKTDSPLALEAGFSSVPALDKAPPGAASPNYAEPPSARALSIPSGGSHGPVFNRRSATPHPYELALQHLEAGHDVAMAANFRYDHRVSPAREEKLLDFGADPTDPTFLDKAYKRYFQDQVRFRRDDPDYLDESLNSHNVVFGGTQNLKPFSSGLPLARILVLNQLQQVFQGAQELFEGLPSSANDTIGTFLDQKLLDKDRDETEQFVKLVLAALEKARNWAPYQPAWVVPWTEIEPIVEQGADRWAELVGKEMLFDSASVAPIDVVERDPSWPPSQGAWLLVLQYTAQDAGTLVRPTVLDAGWYGYHFPSGPGEPVEAGGHPMDLASSRQSLSGVLLPTEFIHSQIPHTFSQWEAAGRLLQRTSRSTEPALGAFRCRHWDRLAALDPKVSNGWMPRPEP